MKNFTKLIIICLTLALPSYMMAQCDPPAPDGTGCYDSGETDVVLFEITADDAIICAGSFETNWDDLTVYSGAPGSGTGGTIVFGPADGDLSGTLLSTAAAGETLIFVSNSDGSVSCASGSEDALEVFIGTECPTFTPPPPNLMPACGETVSYPSCLDGYPASDNTVITVCPDPGGYAGITFTYVDIESNSTCSWDAITIATPSGSQGPLCGEPDGDGGVGSGLVPGDCFYTTEPDECITVTFTSDGSVQETGFEFVVTCVMGAGEDACTAGTPLPVELLSFNAKAMEDENMVTWQTASEENTQWHIVERSVNGQSDWKEIGRVSAAGNSSEIISYEYMDRAPLAIAYYRLRSVDYDAYEDLSSIVRVERERIDGGVSVYPNPTKGTANVDFDLGQSENVLVTLTDITGKVISYDSIVAQRGTNNHQIEMTNLSDGIYFISVETSLGKTTQRIVKN